MKLNLIACTLFFIASASTAQLSYDPADSIDFEGALNLYLCTDKIGTVLSSTCEDQVLQVAEGLLQSFPLNSTGGSAYIYRDLTGGCHSEYATVCGGCGFAIADASGATALGMRLRAGRSAVGWRASHEAALSASLISCWQPNEFIACDASAKSSAGPAAQVSWTVLQEGVLVLERADLTTQQSPGCPNQVTLTYGPSFEDGLLQVGFGLSTPNCTGDSARGVDQIVASPGNGSFSVSVSSGWQTSLEGNCGSATCFAEPCSASGYVDGSWDAVIVIRYYRGEGDVRCAADADADGFINQADLNLVVSSYNKLFDEDGYEIDADFDGSLKVDIDDLNLVLTNFDSEDACFE